MEIPLFPLPNLVLFPNVILPLYIFEERYKQMINRCIDSGDVFGLVLLRQGAQEETEQTIHRVGTTARVVRTERLEGGRMNILCQGDSRFRVVRFTRKTPFWMADVSFIEDESETDDVLKPLQDEVASLYAKAYQLGVQLGLFEETELRLPGFPVELSFLVSYVLDIEAEQKQTLLELKSTAQRLRDLITHVDDAIRKLEKQITYKQIVNKVRGNGDLGKPGTGAG